MTRRTITRFKAGQAITTDVTDETSGSSTAEGSQHLASAGRAASAAFTRDTISPNRTRALPPSHAIQPGKPKGF